MDVNDFHLAGRMTADPKLSYLSDNTPVCNFSLASNRRWKGKDGQKKESVLFIDCVMFRGAAEYVGQNAKKGTELYVTGWLEQQEWKDKEDNTHRKLVLQVQTFQFTQPKGRDGSASADDPAF